ncbi:helix-turn-helix transcriptional regulator [Butyrivibrio sp. WCE2006]|uniref:helix-turn-helix transcriptional regulator n=1 Tax=Butyrivibrio sp. WCE2006 TaxID=1410611 RepID=UPI0005D21B79|nr:helix-turn-helix transcriptional regulator [Butyrivibrio sp. WCE2006]
MKRLSLEKMANVIRESRTAMGITQDELSKKTGINRQMIGRMEQNKYIPSILQLEELANALKFDITSLFEDSEPAVYTAFRKSEMSLEEQAGVDHMFEMMRAAKQQILLRKALRHE